MLSHQSTINIRLSVILDRIESNLHNPDPIRGAHVAPCGCWSCHDRRHQTPPCTVKFSLVPGSHRGYSWMVIPRDGKFIGNDPKLDQLMLLKHAFLINGFQRIPRWGSTADCACMFHQWHWLKPLFQGWSNGSFWRPIGYPTHHFSRKPTHHLLWPSSQIKWTNGSMEGYFDSEIFWRYHEESPDTHWLIHCGPRKWVRTLWHDWLHDWLYSCTAEH